VHLVLLLGDGAQLRIGRVSNDCAFREDSKRCLGRLRLSLVVFSAAVWVYVRGVFFMVLLPLIEH